MAVNIVITGNIYNEYGTQYTGSEIAYQPYFANVVGGGSASIWGTVKYSIFGQYNFNLADNDLLTTAGEVSSGDVVIVVFWSPNSVDRSVGCEHLNNWSVCRFVLGTGPGMVSDSLYVADIQILPNICPNLMWSLQNTGLAGASITANNASTDTHQWIFSGTELYQRDTWYGEQLMSVNNVDNSSYDWGDGNQDNNLSGTTNGIHSWAMSGDYDVELVVKDVCGCTVTGTEHIRVFNNPPVPNITMFPSDPQPNEIVTFQYTGTDIDDTITNIAWTIVDSGIYGNTDTISATNVRDVVVPHSEGQGTQWYGEASNVGAFTNSGGHVVYIVVSWWDGFVTQTMNYNESFTQGIFSGPAVNFTQVPNDAEKDLQVIFTNTSTNTGRVGLGLPNHIEYNWRWIDGALVENEIDKVYGYELIKIPTTASCEVQLCAQWSDGWDTQETCVEKDVVFKTTITVSEEDCYYNLNIIGTSTDGSVSGYGWTISSGISAVGPWAETWTSPIGLNQNDKKICFTSLGWYKIEGTVYGTGSSTCDDEALYITSVCPPSESIKNIWNGTGVLDIGSDWTHSAFGVETEQARHSGTYGLDAIGMSNNTSILFLAPGVSNILLDDYDFLRLWVNVRDWVSGINMTVQFKTVGSSNSDIVNLNSYLDTGILDVWQKALIPVTDFGFNTGGIYLNKLILKSKGNISIWLDDIALTMGTREQIAISICAPDIHAHEFGVKGTTTKEVKPAMRSYPDIQNGPRIINTFPPPSVS